MKQEPTTENKMVRRKRRKKLPWGGARPGAGRPKSVPPNARTFHIRMTAKENIAVRNLLRYLRRSRK